MAEHFVKPPNWEWYILGYFFLAGLAGGSYAIAAILRLWGSPRDGAIARIGFLIAFPLVIVCPILLTLDLGQPGRFFHMLVSTTPGQSGLMFKYWSPMSVGSWALLIFGFFAFISFLEALALEQRPQAPGGTAPVSVLSGGFGRAFTFVGLLLGLFIASYTGVLLSVSNQPIWSDTWTLGGLFLASALSGSAALLSWLARRRRDTESTERNLQEADGYFALLELVLIVIFFITLAATGTIGRALAGPWLLIWVLVLASLIPPLLSLAGRGGRAASTAAVVPVIVLIGVLLMRFVVIFSAQM